MVMQPSYERIDAKTMRRFCLATRHAFDTGDWRLCQCIRTALIFEYHVAEDDIIALVRSFGCSGRGWVEMVSATALCH